MSADASLHATTLFRFDNSYARELEGLYERWQAAGAPAPRLLAFNRSLAAELGADPDALATDEGLAVLVGNTTARPLVDGDRVEVRVGRAEVRPSPRAGLFGRPVDIDTADAAALLGLPGIGPHTAAAIVAYREQHGPFGDVRALSVVPGIGPATLDRLAANAVATGTPRAPVDAGPLDPNTASAAALEAWPGVGPALAARIVEARPFERCEALDRVKGIGPAVLAKIAPVCAVAP